MYKKILGRLLIVKKKIVTLAKIKSRLCASFSCHRRQAELSEVDEAAFDFASGVEGDRVSAGGQFDFADGGSLIVIPGARAEDAAFDSNQARPFRLALSATGRGGDLDDVIIAGGIVGAGPGEPN